MAAEIRYRYKGHFVSRADAARIGNLPRASKYLTSEYVIERKPTGSYAGYRKPVSAQIEAALRADRERAAARRAAAVPPRKAVKDIKREREFTAERKRADRIARDAAIYATEEDVDIDEAMDAVGFDEGDYGFFDYDSVAGMAQDYADEGEGYFDFNMKDLEDDEPYG